MDNESNMSNCKIAVIGMGYVGLPLAAAFSACHPVIGFDLNREKIDGYKQGIDPTEMLGAEGLSASGIFFTAEENDLNGADVYIIAVPTPITDDKRPDMGPLRAASEVVGRHICRGAIVIYESTVYPGATEEFCVPVLEEVSGYRFGEDFTVGYSPERVNPGDHLHQVTDVVKIVSGSDEETADKVAGLYEEVIDAGVFRASSIKVAEAAKLAENSQRDLNIAFVNELAMVFDMMDIPTGEVIDAMNTKWNALGFYPGLVGGHCIGVDPYYFIHQAAEFGYRDSLVIAGRKVNDSMGGFIAERIVRELSQKGLAPSQAVVAILGVTFKEDCADLRNTGVLNIVKTLRAYGVEPRILDPVANGSEVERLFGCSLSDPETVDNADCLVLAVAHEEYQNMDEAGIRRFFGDRSPEESIIIDVKGIGDRSLLKGKGYTYWSLT